MCESRFYQLSTNGNLAPLKNLQEALVSVKKGHLTWFDYYAPTREALSELIEPLNLHPLSIEDCTDTNQIPKLDDFPHNTFIIFNAFSYFNGRLIVDEVDLFIGEKFLITVSGFESNSRKPLAGIDKIIERDIANARQGSAFLMHIVLDAIVDQKFVTIEALEDRLDILEEDMLANPASFDAAEMLQLRRDLLALRKSLFNEREILVKICRRDCPFVDDKAIFHYRDIYDHLAKFFELTEAYRDILTSLMELHASMVNNVLAKTSNETNTTVRRLTLITTIFMPLTLLAGIGGMSEWSMMTGPENWKIAYPAFLLGMVVIGIINYYFLLRLERR